jgi:transglutaminase-like putative cysteine protease
MRYHVVHKTGYSYNDMVPLCYNEIRLTPRQTSRQSVVSHELRIHPVAAERHDRIDFFGNNVTWMAIQEPHRELLVHADSVVDVAPPPEPKDDMPWERAGDALSGRLDGEALSARQYQFASPFVPRDERLADYARPSFAPGRPLVAAALDLTLRICHDFTFDSGATTIGTPVLQVLEHRHGVCQDFAHLEIGCLRSLGITARYVSGYVVTRPPPGKPRLVGADASHAWIAVFVPSIGWVDYDPTNGVIPSSEHLTLGWGRDFGDLSPVKGVMTGGRRHTLSYSVDIEPIPPEPIMRGAPGAAAVP